MPLDGAPVQITLVRRCDEIDDRLWELCFPAPLEGRFWYRTLETSNLESQFEFAYGVIAARGQTIGIAPCFVHNVPMSLVAPPVAAFFFNTASRVFPSAGYQRTLFLGSPCADEGTVGLVPGIALADVVDELGVFARETAKSFRAPLVVWKDFAEHDLPALQRLTQAGGFFTIPSYPGTKATLPGKTTEDYFQSLSSSHRHNLRKKLRRSRETIELETSVIAQPSDRELGEIFGLFLQTFEKGKTKFERLDRTFFERVRNLEPVRFILQREKATGELVTFMMVLRIGDRLINKFIGLDYRRAGKSYLYFRLFEAALDHAYATGATELQSGQTGYRAKIDLGHALVPLFNVSRHCNPLVNFVYRQIARGVSWKTLDSDLANYLRAHPDAESTSPGK